MKARAVKGLDPDGALADNVERIVRVRLDELYSLVPRAFDPRRVEALHDMRIAGKRLRYILETTAVCFGPYARTAAKRAKAIQDLLGEIHDCDVKLPLVREHVDHLRRQDVAAVLDAAGDAEDLPPELVAEAPNREAYAGLELLTNHFEARRALLFGRFLTLWDQLQAEGFRARLEYALTQRPPAVPSTVEDPT